MAKEVSIDKLKIGGSIYCTYTVDANRNAMRSLSKSAYYLYTYFLQNQDGYNFILRRTHVMSITGLSKSSYYDALQELIDKKYIINCKDGYEFHETPQEEDL